jgi:transcriptional regulator with XRE-family HTH domain
MKRQNKGQFVPAKPHSKLTTGEVIRMLRDLKGWTQAELAKRCGMAATNISLLENGKVEIGKRRAEQIAKDIRVGPLT